MQNSTENKNTRNAKLANLGNVITIAINKVSQAAGIIATLFLLVMMLLTTSDVFLRYVFNAPIVGGTELNEYFMIVAGFLGLAWCAIKGAHVKVDILINRLPARAQVFVDTITMLIGMTVVPLVAWQCLKKAKYVYLQNTSSSILHIPEWPFYVIEGLGYALLALVMILLIFRLIGNTIKR